MYVYIYTHIYIYIGMENTQIHNGSWIRQKKTYMHGSSCYDSEDVTALDWSFLRVLQSHAVSCDMSS